MLNLFQHPLSFVQRHSSSVIAGSTRNLTINQRIPDQVRNEALPLRIKFGRTLLVICD
jgi:hypothetical protein